MKWKTLTLETTFANLYQVLNLKMKLLNSENLIFAQSILETLVVFTRI